MPTVINIIKSRKPVRIFSLNVTIRVMGEKTRIINVGVFDFFLKSVYPLRKLNSHLKIPIFLIPNLPHPNLPLCPIYPPQIMTKHLCFSPNYYTYFEGGLTSHIKRKENRYDWVQQHSSYFCTVFQFYPISPCW